MQDSVSASGCSAGHNQHCARPSSPPSVDPSSSSPAHADPFTESFTRENRHVTENCAVIHVGGETCSMAEYSAQWLVVVQ